MKRTTVLTLAGIILAIISSACLEGCRSHKENVTPGAATKEWTALSLPVKIRIAEPQKASLSGTATFERGRSVSLSFRMIGMEVAQARLTADSATVIDKFHKKYISVDPADFMSRAGLDMTSLQDLLLGIKDTRGAAEATVRGSRDILSIEYTGEAATPFGEMATGIAWKSAIRGKTVSGTIEWDFGRARWDSDVTVRPLAVPAGYSEIDLTKLLTFE